LLATPYKLAGAASNATPEPDDGRFRAVDSKSLATNSIVSAIGETTDEIKTAFSGEKSYSD
jgi:hypothetical protein